MTETEGVFESDPAGELAAPAAAPARISYAAPKSLLRLENLAQRYKLGLLVIAMGLVFVVPALGLDAYQRYLWTLTLVYLLPAAGLNLMLGYAGQISLAQGAFLGVGAYSVGVLAGDLPFGVNLVIGTAIGFVLGLVLGVPAIRIRHHYLAMVTLAANIVFVIVVTNQGFTGGALGILNVPKPAGFTTDLSYHVLVACIAAASMLILFWILNSPWGNAFKAIRENEQRAATVGVNVRAYKVLAFAVGSALAALGGGLLAPLLTFVNPPSFDLTVSLQFLLIVLIGGRGRFVGAFLGTVVVVVVPELFRFTEGLLPLIFAAIALLIVLFLPAGAMGALDQLTRAAAGRLAGRGSDEAATR